ncbi:SAM-dependent MidA family methyltransferase [Tumebacillus sp. BK434]|uniref:class I SAM-dependent methyltransferase n=1 Tax=Tumebacillus sp. BK434 TaxID=2512169 RepID=UPI0010518A7A|nr:SAM-dependent methyltransferase [Tumebacillus sp. BK434]TCP52807.1 SAM-dependent MidA family methyltransferase [Tumebacillus sp. BK434]
MTELGKWMAAQIRQGGPVPFAQFMEWALYHPELGYYTGERRKFGKAGDFYTSPGINPVFAEVLADQLAEKASLVAAEPFVLLEFGAGEGMLARDLLNRWQAEHPALYANAEYRIVEISPALRARQAELTGAHPGKVAWMTREEVLAGGAFVGAVLTNEFVDAFPVHRVVKQDGGLAELYVDWEAEPRRTDGMFDMEVRADMAAGLPREQLEQDSSEAVPGRSVHDEGAFEPGRYVVIPGALSDVRIEEYAAAYAAGMIRGQVTEVGLPGLDWYQEVAGLLQQGWILTIDYGFDAEMLHHKSRMDGTLRGFYQHTLVSDPFQHVGEMDLTADVNFTALQAVGEQAGLVTEFYGSQAKYLLQSGILQRLKDVFSADLINDPDMKRNRAIKQLIMPGGIGDHFKVLVQSRGVSVL